MEVRCRCGEGAAPSVLSLKTDSAHGPIARLALKQLTPLPVVSRDSPPSNCQGLPNPRSEPSPPLGPLRRVRVAAALPQGEDSKSKLCEKYSALPRMRPWLLISVLMTVAWGQSLNLGELPFPHLQNREVKIAAPQDCWEVQKENPCLLQIDPKSNSLKSSCFQ